MIPAVASGLRPLAKALVKGGLTFFDVVKESVAEASEQINDLVKETRAEMAEAPRHSSNESEEESVDTPKVSADLRDDLLLH